MPLKNKSRRSFLNTSTQSLLSLIVASCASNRSVSSLYSRKEKVAIVGAGMAGLSTARILEDSGQYDVHIYEARKRIGGRILTQSGADGSPLEYGAAWIHGINGNPIANLCQKLGQLYVLTDNGNKLMFDHFVALSNKEYQNIDKKFKHITKKIYNDIMKSDAPLSVAAGFKKYAPKNSKMNELVHCLMTNNIVETYNADAEDLLANDLMEELTVNHNDGGNHVLLEGYTPLVLALAQKLKIHLAKFLESVQLHPHGVRLKFKDGPIEDFDRVVITVPLSILKANAIQFDPPLPVKKQQAIDQIGFGHFTKLFMTFPKSFWPNNTPWIEFNHSNIHRVSQFFSMKDYTNSNTLVGTCGGSHALAWQDMGKAKVAAMALSQIQKVFPNCPDPIFFDITSWSQQEETRGAYSYSSIKTQSSDRDNLAQPILNRIYFAGEACESGNYASVHGAYISGEKAALKILKNRKA